MLKSFYFLCTSIFLCLALPAQQYGVFLEAFTESVDKTYFSRLPYQVDERLDESGKFFRYYVAPIKTEAEANEIKSKAIVGGFKDARVVDFVEMREHCASACRRKSKDDPGFIDSGPCALKCATGDARSSSVYVLPQYFPQGSAGISDESAVSTLFEILRERKGYSVSVKGFADTKSGEPASMATDRAKAVKDYLISLGISPSRISISTGGLDELSNYHPLLAEDLIDARQEYRRAELLVKDHHGRIANFRYNH